MNDPTYRKVAVTVETAGVRISDKVLDSGPRLRHNRTMNTNQNTTITPAYLDRDGMVWTVTEGGRLIFGANLVRTKEDAEREYGPLIPLWPKGKEPLPGNAYVWTLGNLTVELTKRIVEGAHVTLEKNGKKSSGFITVTDGGWKQLGGVEGPYLIDDEGDFCIIVRSADRITIVPPEGKAPQPDAFVWTKGDDDEELKHRIVVGAHVTLESNGETRSGVVTVTNDGWKRLGGGGTLLAYSNGVPCALVRLADRITIVPPPEPELPEWVTYRGDGWSRMIAATPDGQVWWPTLSGGWKREGVDPITAAELIARGGRLLIDHTGHAVDGK